MDTEEALSISVNIADRSYKLRIPHSEEETLRRAVKLIEEQMKEYSAMYAYKDKQDLLAMVSLGYVTQWIRFTEENKYKDTDLLNSLLEIENLLTENLSS